jgi:class 3 adenylate cyclase
MTTPLLWSGSRLRSGDLEVQDAFVGIPETRYAKSVDDVHIAYQVIGDGPIDLVFAPGTISHVEIYWEDPRLARFLRRLASFARLMFFDKRGTGLSDRVTEAASLEERMDDIRAVMDACGSERAMVLGASEGAPMAVMFGATYPERTVGLILYGGYAKGLPDDDYPWAPTREEQLAEIEEEQTRWGSWDADEWVDADPSARDDPSVAAWWNKIFRYGSSPNASRALGLMNMDVDISHILPTIRVPTLVLHRTGDQACKVEEGRYTAERIPGSTFVEMPGAVHSPWLGDTDAIVDRIEAFTKESWREIEPDRVLATVLFTDIVDSTAQSAALGDHGWKELQTQHDQAVRANLARYRGREIRRMGDGFLATFDGPARGVRCADAIVAAMQPLGIEIRAGLHTGEVAIEGDDIAGLGVAIGARVGALARPSEVLVSQTVKDLTAGSGLRFEDAGEHELKGVPDRWHLYRVVK